MNNEEIARKCSELGMIQTRGDLGQAIAEIVLSFSPQDIRQMRWNFRGAIRDINPELREKLDEAITAHLHGTYQAIRLMHQQGAFIHMGTDLTKVAGSYWIMVKEQCSTGPEEKVRLRFLKYLLSGFCMFVQELPGHPVGMPFPGGEKVTFIDGNYYCPVREKAHDVDAALCPFCPALQTPEPGYLKPPVKAGRYRKDTFLRQTFDQHYYNG